MSKKRFKVATFNLYNLVSPEHKYYGGRRYSPGQYEAKIHWTAEQLRRMDGDIVGFQEIFCRDALQEALGESGIYPNATALVGDGDGKRPVVGLVSRFPILNTALSLVFLQAHSSRSMTRACHAAAFHEPSYTPGSRSAKG